MSDEPVWYWSTVGAVPLWEAVYLSVGGDPTHYDPADDHEDSKFSYRLGIAKSRAGKRRGDLPVVNDDALLDAMEVRLPDFVRWARQQGWSMPQQFDELGDRGSDASPSRPSGKTESTQSMIIAALCTMLSRRLEVDEFTPETARLVTEKPRALADEIVQLAAARGIKLSERSLTNYIREGADSIAFIGG